MNDCIEVHSLRTYSLNCIDTSIINAKCIISAALSCNPPALFMWKKQSVLTGFSYFSVVKENSEQYYESNTITLMTYERLMFILGQMLQTLSIPGISVLAFFMLACIVLPVRLITAYGKSVPLSQVGQPMQSIQFSALILSFSMPSLKDLSQSVSKYGGLQFVQGAFKDFRL